MLEVLEERIIASLPAVQPLVAEEASDIVGVGRAGVEEETGVGKLFEYVSVGQEYGVVKRIHSRAQCFDVARPGSWPVHSRLKLAS